MLPRISDRPRSSSVVSNVVACAIAVTRRVTPASAIAPIAVFLCADANAADRLVPQQYATIQAAVTAAANGDRVLVAAGTYTESVSLQGKSIELRPAVVGAQVVLRGPRNQRALRFVSGESAECKVIGLRLAGALPAGVYGGGVVVQGSSPRLEGCVIDGITWSVSAGTWGGAADVVSGAPVFASCIFEGNRVVQASAVDGGAMLVRGGSPRLESCVFRSNGTSPATQGADLFLVSSAPVVATLAGCRFEGVSGGGFGARVYNYGQGGGAARAILEDCDFTGIVQQAISLIHGWDSVRLERVRFIDCVITGYPRSGAPGCLVTQGRSSLTVVDSEFDSNAATALLCVDPSQGGRAELSGTRFCGNTPVGPDFGSVILDLGGNAVRVACCAADLTGNGAVDGVDLAAILSSWGAAGKGEFAADVTGDGLVNGADLAVVLSGWGPCPD